MTTSSTGEGSPSPQHAADSSSTGTETQPVWTFARRVGRFLRRNWMWGAVLAFGVYLWYDISPNIDLPESGPQAPDFTLQRMNGETFQLSEHRGEVVVLNVWATWCPPCRVEIPGFVDLQRQFREDGVTFVGLSVDEEGLAAVRQFAEDQTLNYPQVADRGVAYRKYGSTTTVPRTFVIDKRGQIRYQHTGLLLKGALKPVLEQLTSESGPDG
ncbi:TlpA disulfide reductase family protein [Salinibacter sp. 10B]|uniref:TlpA family protein disulfide reductase n=1 Tax=Salinibacter sp. 10B TaxID=1923971 RepID=UPI000CF4A6D4|nr:TlpA disulfide reductase family protein [Salinibacter sp. 10B]